jgi:hypothetical protein
VNLFDLVGDAGSSQPASITELRLGTEPATVRLFTSDVEAARLHWESGEPYRTYIVCPGPGCPVCFLGSAPQNCGLIPVYNLETRSVEVLRFSTRQSPGSLVTLLMQLLRDEGIAEKVVLLSRDGSRYSARSQPLAADADHGDAAIASFVEAQKVGLKLAGAFPQPAAAELAEVERVRRKLDAVGGYKLPATES